MLTWPVMQTRGTASKPWMIAGLLALALLYVFPYFPRLNNPNENARFYMTAALFEQGTYRIDMPRTRWGYANDAACVDVAQEEHRPCIGRDPAAGFERRLYSIKAPLTSFLALPGYALEYAWSGGHVDRDRALWLCRLSGTLLPMLAFFVFCFRFFRESTEEVFAADAAFWGLGLGSALLAYSYLLVSHATAAAAAFTAFACLYRARRSGQAAGTRWPSDVLAGLCAAAATGFDYQALPVSVLLCAQAMLVLRPPARLFRFAAGAILPTLLVAHFHWRAFGSPWTPAHIFAETPYFRETHTQGLYGVHHFDPKAAYSLLFDQRVGMFVTSPMLTLAMLGVVARMRRRGERLEAGFAIASVVILYLLLSSMRNWDGGWATGPRLLTVILPYVAWFVAGGLDLLMRGRAWLAVALGLSLQAASFVCGGLPAMYYPHIPESIRAPVIQLIVPLVKYDFAPSTAANWLGIFGTLSMLPVLALEITVLGLLLRELGDLRKWRGALALSFLLAPLWVAPSLYGTHEKDADLALGFITRTWTPAAHDALSRRIRYAREHPGTAEAAKLRELLRRIGREDDLRAAKLRSSNRRIASKRVISNGGVAACSHGCARAPAGTKPLPW